MANNIKSASARSSRKKCLIRFNVLSPIKSQIKSGLSSPATGAIASNSTVSSNTFIRSPWVFQLARVGDRLHTGRHFQKPPPNIRSQGVSAACRGFPMNWHSRLIQPGSRFVSTACVVAGTSSTNRLTYRLVCELQQLDGLVVQHLAANSPADVKLHLSRRCDVGVYRDL